MVRGNLGAALQGFVALPLLVGYDLDDPDPARAGRIVSFDAAGGWNVEKRATSRWAPARSSPKSSMKKLYARVADADAALRVAVEALYDAADDDSATGGPDLVRGIYPVVVVRHRRRGGRRGTDRGRSPRSSQSRSRRTFVPTADPHRSCDAARADP